VEQITDSDLYLRYVLGRVDPEVLHTARERHLRCNPVLAQFIVDPAFEPVVAAGPWNKRELDPDYVRAEEELVSRGWRRLHEVRKLGLPIVEYPLPEILAELKARAGWDALAPSPSSSPEVLKTQADSGTHVD